MISSRFLCPMGVLLAGASRALAFDRISIPTTVKADTDVEVTIANDIATGSKSFDAGFTNYNLYLSTTPPGWGTGPVCVLANGTKIDVTSVKVKIPADAIPDGSEFKITAMEWNSDPNKDGPSGFQYSNDFSFSGGTAEWGKTELGGSTLGDMDRIPCTAYSCARKCNDKYFDERNTTSQDPSVYKNTYECVAACPGTTFPSWDSIINDNGDGQGSGARAGPSGSATATATRSGASAIASTSPTGSSTSTPTSAQSSSSPSQTPNGAVSVTAKASGLVFAGLAITFSFL
ncbi:hypothetical protein BDP81DRAFT_425049 [Colletotrichum phormii]|uniref:Uncharacterized protein n=1 Tax=Colletotrichum phormii TaxID=359342 RepID=A0AAI9ZV92_9PEZI|nr:uncharacterized protein BDP81DRAFT_425049 [Colletotrichum phormii]KAK1638475.1 hypothetical protein BDP81DRAFT_425049 [Colletotrichum phormii]